MLARPFTRLHNLVVSCAALALMFAAAAPAHAQAWRFAVSPAAGGLSSNTSFAAPIPGSVIGDYDATVNPTGTQTRPGLFGGSGNQVIDFDVTLQAAGASTLHPISSFVLDLDSGAGTSAISGFSANLVTGSPLALNLTLQLLYQSFHTVNPTAVFPGGIAIPLPLGQINVNSLTLEQTGGTSIGTLVEGTPGHFTFAIAAAAQATMQIDAFGQTLDLGPLPVPLALNGSIVINGGSAALTLEPSIDFNQSTPGPFPGGAFENLPLDVPTVLPPGSTAHLLFTGEVESLSLALKVGGQVSAAGTRLGDADHNGAVDVDDIIEVILQWGPCPPARIGAGACRADLNGDGAVQILDLEEVIANFDDSTQAHNAAYWLSRRRMR